MRVLQIGAGFRDYKSRQDGLQIGAALGISNRGKEITNRGRDFKSRQRDFKSAQRLQIRAIGISSRCRDYKLVQNKDKSKTEKLEKIAKVSKVRTYAVNSLSSNAYMRK